MYKLLAVFLFFTLLTKAQCPGPSGGAANCDPILSEIRMDTPNFVDFTFDSFSKINGGMQFYGSTQIKIITQNKIIWWVIN